jgi:hypothetical protein
VPSAAAAATADPRVEEAEAAPRATARENRRPAAATRESKSLPATEPATAPAVAESPPPQTSPVAAEEPVVEAPRPGEPGRLLVRLRHRINSGTLTLLANGRPVLEGEFVKKKLVMSKVSEWEPIKLPEGRHRLSARVVGGKGKQYESAPLDVTLQAGGTLNVTVAIEDQALQLVAD